MVWTQLEHAPARYRRPSDARIAIWTCSACGAYTWDEVGTNGEFRGRFVWPGGTALVTRLSERRVVDELI